MKLQLKRSNVLENGDAKQPTASQLEYGELAVNYNSGDPSIFLKDSNNNVIRISGIGNISDTGQVELPASTTPPLNPEPGNLWFNSDEGRLYIYYKDTDSEQWVDASPDSYDPSVIPDMSDPNYQPGTLDDRYNSSQVGELPPDVNLRNEGALWWNSQDDEGRLYVLYNDPAPDGRKKWIEASPSRASDGSEVVVQPTPPDVNRYGSGTLWWNSDETDMQLYVLYNDPAPDAGLKWVEASPMPGTDGGAYILKQDNGNLQTITGGGGLQTDGSASFAAGDLEIRDSGQVRSTNGFLAYGTNMNSTPFRVSTAADGDPSGNIVRIFNDGSAEFAGNVTAGEDPTGGVGIGVSITSDGYYQACRSGGLIFRGYTQGNTTATSQINADGSAVFAGQVSAGDPVSGIYGVSAVTNANSAGAQASVNALNYNSSGLVFRGRSDGSTTTSRIYSDGRASFTGTLANVELNNNYGFQTYKKSSDATSICLACFSDFGTTNQQKFQVLANGDVSWIGTSSGARMLINLEPDNPANYTTTTDADGNETQVYNGPTLDVKERLTKTATALTALKAAASDSNTTLADLKSAFVAALADF